MSFYAKELKLSDDPQKWKTETEKWAKELTEQLNYTLNHLDETNLTEGLREQVAGRKMNDAAKNEMDKTYRELRELIIARTR